MHDLISRHAAIDGRISIQRTNGVEIYCDEAMPVGYLKRLPSAQPDIIRCKDCKYRYVDGENVRFNVCELNHNKVQSDNLP